MQLFDLIRNKKPLTEGGNVSSQSPGWQGAPDQEAEEIDLKIHDRDFMVSQLRTLLTAQNDSFNAAYGRYIWDPKLLQSGQMFSGSSLQFFDVKGVNTQDFLNKLKKTKVGDIDTQIDQDIGDEVTAWLKSVIGKRVGNGTFLGFNSSLSSIWLLDDPKVRVQVDYELGPYDPKTNAPTEWFAYSHSSHYDDMAAGIKGVFHKYINRALTHAQTSTKYVARVMKKGVKISDEPVTDSDYSFAVSSAQGGGMSLKYKPYIDPATGQPMEKDGIPVMQALDSKDRDYIQNLDQQFQINFNRKRTSADKNLQGSFVGTIQLMNKAFSPEQNEAVARAFLDILFGRGAQMITKDDPVRDRDIKFAAIDAMLLGGNGIKPLNLANGKALRQEAVDMASAYASGFTTKNKPLAEAEVKAQLRKGMPHLRDLKPADFLDLVDELSSEGGRFKLQNIPLNVKIDGFGGRFGKNADGAPFMATSRTEPRYKAGFVDYHKQKGTTDPEILGRAANFDKLFNEMMTAIKLVDSKLGSDFLVNKQVTCEVLFLPFATQTTEGKLKFVGIEYDQLPPGVDLVLVPFRVVDASTGDDVPNGDQIIQDLSELGQSSNVMFMSNRLSQKEGLDVTEIINPLDNLDELKKIVSDTAGKRDRASLELRREVEAKLKPVQIALEKAIDEDPNIIGKNKLGQDYEGIVINSRLGPIKVTSQRQKDIITQKNAAKAAARADQGRDNANKTAVVAVGSFVGHRGHEELFNFTANKAKQVGGDPYLFIGNAVGVDDPIPPDVKVQTWHKLYPQYAKNISAVMQGGSLMQKIKHELINPLPGKPPRYDNIIIMVGEDRASMPIAAALMKAVNKFPGYEHVKVSLEVTPRGTGMSFTKLRNILTAPNASPEQQYSLWSQGFDEQKLGKDWILHLMDITRKGMGIPAKSQQPQPVAEQRLLNALVRPQHTLVLENTPTSQMVKDLINPQGREAQKYAKFDRDREARRAKLEKGALAARNNREYPSEKDEWGDLKKEEFNGEYDDEAGMAQSNLRTMARAVDGLLKTIKSNDNLPEWGQEKIAKAEMMLVSVWDYLLSQKELGMDPKISESRALLRLKQIVAELSNEKLGQYKKAASADASAADKAGDYKRGNKRFSGIVKATKKQFANDEKSSSVEEDWQKVNKSDKTDGMSKKAVSAYRRENPGSKLKTAVTKKPSELKPGSKDANRRKSFCARMSGVDGPMKDEKGRPTAKAKALSRWNCNEDVTDSSEDSAEKYKANLLKTAPRIMDFLAKTVKGWRPSEKEMLGAIDTAYIVMKHTGDIKQAGKAMMDELNTLHRMSQGHQGVAEAKFEYTPQGTSLITDPEEYKRWRDQREIESVFGDTPRHIRMARTGMYKKSIATPRQWKMLFDLTDEQGRFLPRMSKGHAAGAADKKAGKDINSNPFTPGSDEHRDWVGGWKSVELESMFAGTAKNKLGSAGQWKNTGPSKNRPARAGDLVGGSAQEGVNKKKGADGKACWKGYRYNGTENGKDKCVPVSEDVASIMGALIENILKK